MPTRVVRDCCGVGTPRVARRVESVNEISLADTAAAAAASIGVDWIITRSTFRRAHLDISSSADESIGRCSSSSSSISQDTQPGHTAAMHSRTAVSR